MAIYRQLLKRYSSSHCCFNLASAMGGCVGHDVEKTGVCSHCAWTRAMGTVDTLRFKPYLVFREQRSDSTFEREPLLDRRDQAEHERAL